MSLEEEFATIKFSRIVGEDFTPRVHLLIRIPSIGSRKTEYSMNLEEIYDNEVMWLSNDFSGFFKELDENGFGLEYIPTDDQIFVCIRDSTEMKVILKTPKYTIDTSIDTLERTPMQNQEGFNLVAMSIIAACNKVRKCNNGIMSKYVLVPKIIFCMLQSLNNGIFTGNIDDQTYGHLNDKGPLNDQLGILVKEIKVGLNLDTQQKNILIMDEATKRNLCEIEVLGLDTFKQFSDI